MKLRCCSLAFMLTYSGVVQFVPDGRLQPNESLRTWRNEKTNIDDVAVLSEITILWQIFQVGDVSINATCICSFSLLNAYAYACTLLFFCCQKKHSGL